MSELKVTNLTRAWKITSGDARVGAGFNFCVGIDPIVLWSPVSENQFRVLPGINDNNL